MIKIPPDEANVRELKAKAEALAKEYGFDPEAGPSIEQGERMPLFDFIAALEYPSARNMLEQAQREAALPAGGRDGNVVYLPPDALLEKKRRDVQRDLAAAIEEAYARQIARAAKNWQSIPGDKGLRMAADVVGYEAQEALKRQGREPKD